MNEIIVIFASCLLFAITDAVRADESTSDLIDSIIITRAATVDQIPSGRGSVIVSGVRKVFEENPGASMDGHVHPADLSRHRIDFCFLGDNSIVECFGGTGTDERQRVSAALIRQGDLIRYIGAAKQLFIGTFDPLRSVLPREPLRWTYRDITWIPGVFTSDDSLFLQGMKKKGHISREGNCIVVAYSVSIPQISESWNVTFDMTLGGMVTDYKTEYITSVLDGKARKKAVEVKLQWAHQGDRVVPIRRDEHMVLSYADDPTRIIETKDLTFEFISFKTEDIPSTSFTVQSLRVVPGTTVYNNIIKKQFVYSPGEPEDVYFGGDGGPSTQPAR